MLTGCIFFVLCVKQVSSELDVIYAINAGGDDHLDVNGIHYKRDPLFGKVGTASEYGRSLLIGRVPRQDQIIYQTERYHHSTFGYDIPVAKDGDYVLVLKFSEVYFEAPDQKVFDVVLNGEHVVVQELDIFSKVGKGVAHDEIIPFKIQSNKLLFEGRESTHSGKIRVDFVKGSRDNPKVNAILLLKGSVSDVPMLAPASEASRGAVHVDASQNSAAAGIGDEDELEEADTSHRTHPSEQTTQHPRRPSGPRSPDPYATHEISSFSSLMPIFAAIGAFIPLVFCLCKL